MHGAFSLIILLILVLIRVHKHDVMMLNVYKHTKHWVNNS